MQRLLLVHLALGVCTGLSSLAADTNQEKVDQIFAVYDKPGSPGCALGVIQDGSFTYRKGYGMGSLELGVPLSSQSVFYMGSVSKQFTAAAVVLAAEQGFLSLDDDVRKHIPELPDYGHVITLRQMLHHTSGLRDFETMLYLPGQHLEDVHSKEAMLALIVRQKGLNNIPGEAWLYSNTNYFLLGEVVRRATKKSLAQFSADNIFQPLGMMHTRFYDDHTLVVPGRIPAYDPGSDGKFLVDWSTNFDLVGPGGMMSTVDDLLFWDKNFYENRLGKGTLIKEMLTRGMLNNGKEISYALGLEIGTYRGLPIVKHNGGLFGYRTSVLRFPEQKFAVVSLCNVSSADVEHLSEKVADVYLEKILQAEERTSEPSRGNDFPDPNLFAGKYLDPQKHFSYLFTASSGNLMAWGATLRRVGANQFRDLGTGTITFDDSSGKMKVTLVMDGEAFFSGRRIENLHPSNSELAAYAGRYRSAELGATYDLSISEGRLLLRYSLEAPLKLSPVASDEFENEDIGTLVFRRNTSKQVVGMSLFTVNARGMDFEKVN
jgi:CubicO group peptidase (beta-lactamase class C family)